MTIMAFNRSLRIWLDPYFESAATLSEFISPTTSYIEDGGVWRKINRLKKDVRLPVHRDA